jgi:hypothetical protein
MRIPPGVRSRLKMLTASLCAIAGLVIAWPDALFPGNLIVIPEFLASVSAGPISKITTAGSVYLLQTLGFFFSLEGGLLQIHDSLVDLELASGGLRTLLAVLTVSTATAVFHSGKPAWERFLVAASGMPICLACGVFLVTAGCLLFEGASERFASLVLFDFAGWLTLPLAWGFLLAERELLSRLLIAPPAREIVPVLRGMETPGVHSKSDVTSTAALKDVEPSLSHASRGSERSSVATADVAARQRVASLDTAT